MILNRASIGERSLVGANALVTEAKQFPPGSLIVGAPARVVRGLTTALAYVDTLPVLDPRSPDEILGYDEFGLPR